ncbi:MAG: flavodoxin [Desulfobacteraceae bacterium 4572_19]|nr:MAG: flavodoxin [Desulfobacteraceae bacterium 4572_19]
MTPNKGILGFSGSPRRNGNSDILLKNILEAATQENITCEHYNLTNIQFQGCIGCEKCRKDKICTGLIDGMSVMYYQIISTQGLVLVSPTHNYNITSWMKAFIDRLYCFYNFEKDHPRSWSSQLANQNRKAVVAAICEQENEEDMGYTIEAMAKPLEALGYEIVGKLSVFKIFEKGKIKKDPNAIEQASELGKKLAKSLETQ